MKKAAEAIKSLTEKISAKSGLNKKFLLAGAMLLAGVLFLMVSELNTEPKKVDSKVSETTSGLSASDYVSELENRLVSIISSIDGAGYTKVMVTLESGSEDVYLHDYDYGENIEPSGRNSLERKDEYVIVDGESGEMGIVVRVAEPKIRGVAVVCEGGGSDIVREQITDAVTALLDISSARVSVAKMN